jgi:hypothetical protein
MVAMATAARAGLVRRAVAPISSSTDLADQEDRCRMVVMASAAQAGLVRRAEVPIRGSTGLAARGDR